jgi:hypothetical protein
MQENNLDFLITLPTQFCIICGKEIGEPPTCHGHICEACNILQFSKLHTNTLSKGEILNA